MKKSTSNSIVKTLMESLSGLPLIVLVLLMTLSGNAFKVYAQCPAPLGGGTSGGPCGGTPTSVTFNAVSQGLISTVTSVEHKWYTAATGGSYLGMSTASLIGSGTWQSFFPRTDITQTTTLYASAVCHHNYAAVGTESSARFAVTFTATSPGGISINTTNPINGNVIPPFICQGSSIRLTPQGCSTCTWSTGQTGAITVSPTQNTTYTVSGTESTCGTVTSTSITIEVAPAVGQVSITSGPGSLCQGTPTSSYSAYATNADHYGWSLNPPEAGNINYSTGVVTWDPLFANTATVSVVAFAPSNFNCATQDDFPVVVTPLPGTPTVSNVNALYGSSVTLTASGATTGQTYKWYKQPENSLVSSFPINTATLASPSTAYKVSIYNGCETPAAQRANQTINLYVNPPPVPTISSNTCGPRTITLPAPPTGVTYYWQGTTQNGRSTSTPLPVSPATFTLPGSGTFYINAKVNSMTLWSIDRSFNVVVIDPAVPAMPTVSPNTCGVKTLTRGTPSDGSTWYWQGTNVSGQDQSATAAAVTYSPPASGTYYIRAYKSGCWSSARSVPVTVIDPQPPAVPTVSNNICGARTLTRTTPTDGSTWYWQGTNPMGETQSGVIASAATYSAPVSGTYYIRAYKSGCWSTATGVPVVVNNPLTPTVPTASSNTCGPKTLTRSTPSDGSIWYWQGTNASGQDQSSVAAAGTYQAGATGNYYIRAFKDGCWSTATLKPVTVNNPAPPIIASFSTETCGPKTLTKGTPPAGIGFYWQGNTANGQDYTTTIANAATYVATANGTYYLGAKDAANCWTYSSIVVDIDPVDITLTSYNTAYSLVQATHSITLGPGFIVPAGSTFTARIAITDECNDFINWTEQIIYNQNETPISASKEYYDGLGRSLQSQGKDYLSGKVFVSQPIYNSFGEAAAATLSAPILENGFIYKKKFVANSDGNVYSGADFDLRTSIDAPGEVDNPKVVGEQKGSLGWYYSSNNNLEPLTPVTDYPYSRIYTPEGPDPGISKTASPGNSHRMGTTHEVTSEKLETEVGELDHYYKLRSHFVSQPVSFNTSKVSFVSTGNTAHFPGNSAGIATTSEGISVTCSASGSTSGTWPIGNLNIAVVPGTTYTFMVKGYKNSATPANLYVANSSGTDIVWPGALLPTGGSLNEKWVGSTFTVPAGVTAVKLGVRWNGSVVGDVFNITAVDLRIATPSTSPGYKYITTDADNKKVASFVDLTGREIASALVTSVNTEANPVEYGYDNWSYSYFNNLGQLVATVAPNGVDIGSTALPQFVTTYQYDHFGRPIETSTPDEGTSQFVYSTDGKIRFSQNQEQRNASPPRFSYSNYDYLGRIIESGEYTSVNTWDYDFEPHSIQTPGAHSVLGIVDNVGQNDISKKNAMSTVEDYTYIGYDRQAIDFPDAATSSQKNLLGQVARTENENAISWYSYDEFGRVIKTWQTIKFPLVNPAVTKTIDYTYDYFGNVIEVAYQKNTAESFYHHYAYDLNQRLIEVRTSKNGIDKKLHATYKYYLHGPLKKVILANNLQGIDYVYAISGALKMINNADPAQDPGGEGTDAFGETLHYFDDDYLGANGAKGNQTVAAQANQFSGMLKTTSWHSPTDNHQPKTYAYQYDGRNQLTKAKWGAMGGASGTYSFTEDGVQRHQEGVDSYDKNGNIQALLRKGKDGNILGNYIYDYEPNTNRLDKVRQGTSTIVDYTYNAIGQMTKQDEGPAKVLNVKYSVHGLVKEVRDATDQLLQVYEYDDRGNLLQKVSYSGGTTKYTTYIRDASGTTLAIYVQSGTTTLAAQPAEIPVYGSGRVAIHKPALPNTYFYELKDHLGNVRAVIGDVDTETISATMESEVSEQPPFKNITPRRVPKTPPGIPSGNEMVRMNSNAPDGPGIVLKVSPGDVISMQADAYYEAGVLRDYFVSTSSVVTAISGIFGGVSGAAGEAGSIYDGISGGFGQLFSGGGGGAPPDPEDDDNAPYAFLTYMVFDVNMEFKFGGSKQVSSAANMAMEHLTLAPLQSITEPGYMYVFLYNRSESINWVYFDNLSITHQHSPIVAGADYYPFGMPMEGREITDEPYRYGYQGPFSEKDLTTGWNEFELRMYDARFGRWTSPDPYGQFASPYLGMGNIPNNATDPDGGLCCNDMDFIYQAAMQAQDVNFYDAMNMASTFQAIEVASNAWTAFGEDALWVLKDIGDFATSARILGEIEKGILGTGSLAASINLGYAGDLAPKWNGSYSKILVRFGQGVSVLSSIYTMGNGGLSPRGGQAFSTPSGRVFPVTQPVVAAPTRATDVHGQINASNNKGFDKKFDEELAKIKSGQGTPRIDPNTGKQTIFEGRGLTGRGKWKWEGALEWDVPGTRHRILEKINPDGTSIYARIVDHNYNAIYPFY